MPCPVPAELTRTDRTGAESLTEREQSLARAGGLCDTTQVHTSRGPVSLARGEERQRRDRGELARLGDPSRAEQRGGHASGPPSTQLLG